MWCWRVHGSQASTGRSTLDPMANYSHDWCHFECHYHDDGVTVSLTPLNDLNYYAGRSFEMRVFDPDTGQLPDFNY